MTTADDDAARSDAEERRISTADDDAARSDAEERRISTADDDAARSDAEERRIGTADDARHKPGIRHRLQTAEVKLAPALLVLLVLVAAALTTWLYVSWYRPDNQTNAGAAAVVASAARDGTVAMLSYTPETVDSDLATARSHLTGDFLSYFEDFARQVVAPAAKEKGLTTTAEVVGIAVAELHPESAVVLVFVDQTTTSRQQPEPAMAARSVQVSLSKVDGSWLIARLDPV